MEEKKLSANTVIHHHANIRKALQYAVRTGLIYHNPATLVERPKIDKFSAQFYNKNELEQLFKVVKDDPIELAVILLHFMDYVEAKSSVLNGMQLISKTKLLLSNIR